MARVRIVNDRIVLTRRDRTALYDGGHPTLTWSLEDGPPPSPSPPLSLSSRFFLQFTGRRVEGKVAILSYIVDDRRPRLLGKSGGYVSSTGQAAKTPTEDGYIPEPEAISKSEQDEISAKARARFQEEHEAEQLRRQLRMLNEQLKSAAKHLPPQATAVLLAKVARAIEETGPPKVA